MLGDALLALYVCLRMLEYKMGHPEGLLWCLCVGKGIIRNTLLNIIDLNENALSTTLWKCFGIEAQKQQMLSQAVLTRLFSISLCQMTRVNPAPVPASGPCTLILSYVPLQYGGGYYFRISPQTVVVKNLNQGLMPGAEGRLSFFSTGALCTTAVEGVKQFAHVCMDRRGNTDAHCIYLNVHTHSWRWQHLSQYMIEHLGLTPHRLENAHRSHTG